MFDLKLILIHLLYSKQYIYASLNDGDTFWEMRR